MYNLLCYYHSILNTSFSKPIDSSRYCYFCTIYLQLSRTYAQSDQSLCWSLEYSMNFKLLTEQHLEVLNFTGGCTGSSELTLVRMPHCWKLRVMAQMFPLRAILVCTVLFYRILMTFVPLGQASRPMHTV